MWCAGSGWSFNPIIYSIPTNGSWEESPSSTLFAKRSFMLNFSKYFFPVQVLVLLVKIYCFHFVPLWNTLPCHRKDFFLGHSKQSPSTHRGSKPWWYGDSVGAAYGWRQACWGSHSWRWGPTSGREGPFKKVDLECHKRKNNTSYMNFLMNTYLHSGRLRPLGMHLIMQGHSGYGSIVMVYGEKNTATYIHQEWFEKIMSSWFFKGCRKHSPWIITRHVLMHLPLRTVCRLK